jgi:hypothetical protein
LTIDCLGLKSEGCFCFSSVLVVVVTAAVGMGSVAPTAGMSSYRLLILV